MSTDEFNHTLDVNLRGPALVTKHALSLLLEQEGARVVSLSSNLGQFSTGQMGGDYPPYRVSKVGLGGLTAYLHAEYSDEGLIANAVSPGWVRTDMGGPNANRSPGEGADTPVWLSRFKPGSPGGRLWRDREIIEW
jgi:NAD(P)-dependent dehydrogenase (short-subunit alcohol dehydrogenase family)